MTTRIIQTAAAVLAVSATMAPSFARAAVPFTLAASSPKSLSTAAIAFAEKFETPAKVSADGKTLTFTRKTVRLVVHSGPDSDMLSYRIAGIRNPMLVVPAGATLKVLFINEDEDMKHNLRFGAAKPPFAQTPVLTGTVGTHDLAPHAKEVRHGEELVVRAPESPGTYTYVCTIKGHAKGGMYGTVVVK
jgi:rusticyanin